MMTNPRQLRTLRLGLHVSAMTGAVALAMMFALTVVASQAAQAQTFEVIHNFAGLQDGSFPLAGLTMDKAGNHLYGTASSGGNGYGTVYRLQRSGSNWVVQPLYSFNGSDGAFPEARVIFGTDGSLYGTTTYGGDANQGTGFRLRPPVKVCTHILCPWAETVLYSFSGGADGATPGYGDVLFDKAGNMYGTTSAGGLLTCYPGGCGTVYELTPSSGSWTESVLYSFGTGGGSDGVFPANAVIPEGAGNLYSTTYGGGSLGVSGPGTVFQLMPGSDWTENILYDFAGGAGNPSAGLVFDQQGNLYGATTSGGSGGAGTVFELTLSGGTWNLTTLYSFTGSPGCGPYGTLAIDAAGDNLYGTTYCTGAHSAGNVFKLTSTGASWTYTSVHDFTGGSDGGYPTSNVIVDASSNLYGTATQGGSRGSGVIWEITPQDRD